MVDRQGATLLAAAPDERPVSCVARVYRAMALLLAGAPTRSTLIDVMGTAGCIVPNTSGAKFSWKRELPELWP